MIVKYLRVSTSKQNTDRQELIMDKLGIKFDKEYIDKVSGKNADRPKLNQMLEKLQSGDIVYCESISRLGRSVDDLRALCRTLSQKNITVYFVKEGFNTGGSTYEFLLTILGAVAEMERDLTQERVIQRISQILEIKNNTGDIATRSGRWFGREVKTKESLPKNFEKYYEQMKDDKITKIEMARLLGCGRATLYRWLKLYENK